MVVDEDVFSLDIGNVPISWTGVKRATCARGA
jgi:hypothetical protein